MNGGADTSWTLAGLVMEGGVFRGDLLGPADAAPLLEMAVGSTLRLSATLTVQEPGRWRMEVGLPPSALDDGAIPVRFELAGVGQVSRYMLFAGAPVHGDIGAELAGVKADLAMLRRAFLEFAADPPLRTAERAQIIAEAAARAIGAPESGER